MIIFNILKTRLYSCNIFEKLKNIFKKVNNEENILAGKMVFAGS